MVGNKDDATRIGMEVLPPLSMAGGPAVGGQLAGYRLEAELGRGGMGVVFRAQHAHLRRTVALKVLAPHLASDASFRRRFIQESQTAAALRHPHIVPVHDAGEAEGHLYLAMHYVEGVDLGMALADGPLDPPRAVGLIGQIGSALDAAHEAGLVHRDVKPGNILLEGLHGYLTDFGLATRAAAHTRLTAAGQVVGTADYLAPEQAEGRTVDARADVYALGCVLFHCLAGRPPFQRDSDVQVLYAHMQSAPPSPRTARPELAAGFDDVIARAMAKEPDARFASCGALAQAARGVLDGGEAAGDRPAQPRILVALEGTSRSLIRAGLRGDEFAVEELAPEASLLEVTRSTAPSVLLVDSRRDGPFGPETCRALREDRRTAATRIITIVRRADHDLGREMVQAGAYAYLSVPFSTMQLLVKVRHAITSGS